MLGGTPSAAAQDRVVVVTLLGGVEVRVTVPAGAPLDQVKIPGVALPILAIREEAPAPALAPVVPLPPAPVASAPATGRADDEARATGERARAERRQRRSRGNADRIVSVMPQAELRARVRKRRAVAPSPQNPTYALALPGPAPIGVPNFFIEKFRIPPFLLPIYQAAGIEYGVRWEVLAAINEIETDYGRNLNVSSAGAVGWMQFMPATWKQYGTDANRDGKKDPYNPVDAIFAAARYLKAAGAGQDMGKAIFAYNHADWYVDSVLLRARLIGSIPADLVGSLTGLTQGRFPVDAPTRYARSGRTADLFAAAGSRVVAVQDGRVVRIGLTERLGRFVQLRDVYGNTYTYGRLGAVARQRVAKASGAIPLRELNIGSLVKEGTTIGRTSRAPLAFEIRPAGRAAPRISPKPILDGWKLLESTATYRIAGRNPLTEQGASVGQIMLMSKARLTRKVLANPRIDVYGCGRRDIRAGIVDRRVLVTLEMLAASGMKPTVTSLRCGHGYRTASGNVSHHSSGNAVDIAKINGIPILGHQGPGSITEAAIQRLLTLQGPMKPSQIISLMTFAGADNTLALPDHADHIHIGWQPRYGTEAGKYDAVLKPGQWIKLIDRLGAIDNPVLHVEE